MGQSVAPQFDVGELPDDETVELDRALLNLLNSGRAVTDHFKVYYKQTFKIAGSGDAFEEFLDRLRKGSWAFAFFEDARNYVQHQGLPLADYHRQFTSTSVSLQFTLDCAKLGQGPRAWRYSQLHSRQDKLELVELLKEYYLRMTRDMPTFLAKASSPFRRSSSFLFWPGDRSEKYSAEPSDCVFVPTRNRRKR